MNMEVGIPTSDNNMITIIKTLGDKEPYERSKLEYAIQKAVIHKSIVKDIVDHIESKLDLNVDSEVTTGYINALVEGYMLKKSKNNPDYIKYMNKYIDNKLKKQIELRIKVSHMGDIIKNYKEMSRLKKFSSNQTSIASTRYLLKNLNNGNLSESISEWFDRVASYVVMGSVIHDPEIYNIEPTKMKGGVDNYTAKNLKGYQADLVSSVYNRLYSHMKYNFYETLKRIDESIYPRYKDLKSRYFQMMYEGIFEPNTPTLMNSGSGSGGLSACFTLDVEDNMQSIAGKIWPSAAFIFKMAGGLGVNISKIRPAGDPVADTHGAATGGINLVLEAIDKITDIVKSGGKRRGANMGILEYNHPQILEFIDYKTKPGKLENFNISVMFDQNFWERYFNHEDYLEGMMPLIFNGKEYDEIFVTDLMDKIAENAWKSAEPGVLFKDNMNRKNPLRRIYGDIHITNPCSEQAMYDGESCTLGSINLAKFVDIDGSFNFKDFDKIVRLTTLFLNDVLEVNTYPTTFIETQSNKTKRIGLGIMGFADMLFKMKIRFNSQRAYDLIREIANILYWGSVKKSIQLADQRGPCEAYLELIKSGADPRETIDRIYNEDDNEIRQVFNKGLRNMWTTTIAPTGTISMIADCSQGLEPVFALVYKKTVAAGDFYYLNENFKQALIDEGIYDDDIIRKVESNYGSCQGMDEIPGWIKDTFVTAMDLHWTDHIVSQAIWQQYIDNSISKTINMPYNVTPSDIKYAYILAHELGLKGVSVYRDGSRELQVMHSNTSTVQKQGEIGAKTIINNTIERKSKPSEATLEYIRDNIKNDYVINEFQKILLKNEKQLYLKNDNICGNCKKGIMVNQSGCMSCILCGHSESCNVG